MFLMAWHRVVLLSVMLVAHRYAHRCPVCNKGFQDKRKMTTHHRNHGRLQGPAQEAAAAVLGREIVRMLEQFGGTAAAAPPPAGSSSNRNCRTCATRATGQPCPFQLHGLLHATPLDLCLAGRCARAATARVRRLLEGTGPFGGRLRSWGGSWLRRTCPGSASRCRVWIRTVGAWSRLLGSATARRCCSSRWRVCGTTCCWPNWTRPAVPRSSSRPDSCLRGTASSGTLAPLELRPVGLSARGPVAAAAHLLGQRGQRASWIILTVVDERAGNNQEPIRLMRSCHEYGCVRYGLVCRSKPTVPHQNGCRLSTSSWCC